MAVFARALAPLTVGAGLDEIVLLARLQEGEGEPREVALRFSHSPGAGVGHDGHRAADRADAAARRLHPEGPALAGRAARSTRTSWRRCSPVRAAASSSTTSTSRAASSPSTARRAATAPASSWGWSARRPSATPRASPAWRCSATRPRRSARCRSRSARSSSPRSTSPSRAGIPVEWFALSSGARISMDSGTENMDWVARALRRIITFTQARRRDQRRGGRHQRRRPAVLERRGDDAHAHQGHPGHDARQRDGAHRQALARLLRRRLGRGQLRHRRLRPRHGPERPGAVLGAPPHRRRRPAVRPLRPRLDGARRALGAARADERPGRPRRARLPARPPVERLHDRRRRSSPRPPTPSARSPSTSARSCGR